MTPAPRSAPALLETERLLLRPFALEDDGPLRSLWARNQDRLRESFAPTVEELAERGHGKAYIDARAADWAACRGFWYGAWLRSEAALVGQVHVKRLDWEIGRAELAYLVDATHEGVGLASEAVRRVIAMCFEDLALYKVLLRVVVGNERSARLAVRCGFSLEGTLRGEFLASGRERADVRYFGRLRGDPTPA